MAENGSEDDGADDEAGDDDGDSAMDRLERFEWPIGVLAGSGAFVLNYVLLALLLVVLTVVGNVNFPGSSATRLTRLGFLLYNAHGITIVAETPPGVFAPRANLLQNAAQPFLYRAAPVVGIVAVSGLFTYWRQPDSQEGVDAVATGLSMTLGYLLFILVGSYLFTTTQEVALPAANNTTQGGGTGIVTFHPDRLATLLRGLLYPLVLGTFGSVLGQVVVLGQTGPDEDTPDES